MCLITNNKEKQIAVEDIVVYKLLKRDLISQIKYFQYKLGVLYETKIKEEDKSEEIYWMACCKLDNDYLRQHYGNRADWILNPNLICLSEGFHSAKNIEILKTIQKESIGELYKYKCIIPKGAEFYTDAVGFLVSNKIFIKSQIK